MDDEIIVQTISHGDCYWYRDEQGNNSKRQWLSPEDGYLVIRSFLGDLKHGMNLIFNELKHKMYEF